MEKSIVYLIPSLLSDDNPDCLPDYLTDAILQCRVFFVENERTTRRYFKQLWRTRCPGEDIIIDNYGWVNLTKPDAPARFRETLQKGSTIGIVSEAGCPGVADPGQQLVAIAQEAGVVVKPLVGPSSILLALMASGMSGQEFRFAGYLPVDAAARAKMIREMEADAQKHHCTQIFIETPYRNNQLLEALLQHCRPSTRLCIAADITGKEEMIRTKKIADWKKASPDLHKRPVIFCLSATADPLT